jgi:hypothetical protein
VRHPNTQAGDRQGQAQKPRSQSTKKNRTSRRADLKQILDALEGIAVPNSCVGLWIKGAKDDLLVHTEHRCGYFTDFNALAKAAHSYAGRAAGIYITANPVLRKALDDKTRGWAWNKLSPYPGSPRNDLIYERRRLLIDIDSREKPKDVSATEAEKVAAMKKGRDVRAWLREQGWPDPVMIDSGNGVQLVYRIKLPVESPLVKQTLYALADRFDDDTAVIDKSVSSAKTLARLPGTWNCKGKHTTKRPHRMAHIISAPKKLKLASLELLEKVAGAAVQAQAPSPPAPGLSTDIDLQQAKKYLDQMEPAVRTTSDGSRKALLAARAIVVGFNVPWDSDAAWQLLQHYNDRGKPPWNLADKFQCQDLRRKLKEAHDYAENYGHPRGYLSRGPQRHYEPLEGPEFPLAIPDWDWMARDTPSIVMDNPPVPYAYGLRVLGCWWCERDDVLVPDALVKLAHWGAHPPQHWRKQYRRAMTATKKNFQHLKRVAACSKRCMLHGSLKKLRHRHYKLEYVDGGLFDSFQNDEGNWVFKGPKWTKAVRNGDVYHGYWPVLVFGTTKPVGLTPRQAKRLAVITHELTRLPKRFAGKGNAEGKPVFFKPPSERADRAEIIEQALVANSAYTHDKLVCPALDKDQRYVAFAGNYRQHHGRGYQLRRWLELAGYESSWPAVEEMLADLAILAEKFDLVVVGRHHASSRWYTLQEMQGSLETGAGKLRLREKMVRIYAPEDFLTLWRYRFSKWLGFGWIPGADCPFPTAQARHGHIASSDELRAWMKEQRVTQAQLAERAKIRRQTISENLRRPTSTAGFWKKINKATHNWT